MRSVKQDGLPSSTILIESFILFFGIILIKGHKVDFLFLKKCV